MSEQFAFVTDNHFPPKDVTRKFYYSKNPYDDENAMLQALHKKPLCIIVLGKPCSGRTTLSKKLCSKWKLQLVNALQLLNENVDSDTEIGKSINEIMISGQALDEKMVYNLLTQKLESPECAHYGYVLDDLPIYCQSSIGIEEQMSFIESMNMKPDLIVHIKIPEDDILKRREGLRVDVEDGTLYSSRNYMPEVKLPDEPKEKFANKAEKEKPSKTEDPNDDEADNTPEEDVEAMEEGEDEEDRPREPSHPDFEIVEKERFEYLVSRLEDIPERMKADLKYHEENICPRVTSYVSKFNPFNIIELDGNLTPTELFYNLLVKLQGMNFYPSVAPLRFYGPSNEEEEEVVPEDMDTEELFQTLAIKKMPGPRARWYKSPWKRLCPVALYEGQLSIGKPEFTVGYLGQIFCLSNITNYTLFMKNPRPYLLPPQPRPPFRVIVLGAKSTGKTQLIRVLAESYRARIIDLVGMLQEEYDKILNARLKEVQETTEAIVIKEVTERHEAELEAYKTNKIAEHTSEVITQKITDEIEEDAIKDAAAIYDDETESEEKTSVLSEENSKPFSLYIPEHLRQPVDKNHPEVKTRVKKAIHLAKQEPIELDVDLYINAVRVAVEEVEDELRKNNPGGPYHGQWIIDGLPVRPDVWQGFVEKAPDLLPDLMVYLQDTSQNSEYLIKRWIRLKVEEFSDIESVDPFDNTDSTISQDLESEQLPKVPDEISLLTGRQGQSASTRIKELDKMWSQTSDIISRTTQPLGAPIDIYELDIIDKTMDQMRDEILERLVKQFKLEAVPKTQDDLDEEEEEDAGAFEEEVDEEYEMGEEGMEEGQAENEEEEEEEGGGEELGEGEGEEEDEEPDPSRNLQKKLGLTSYFCPVTLHEHEVLRAGDPDIAAVYRNLVYYFANEDARLKFIENPDKILNTENGLIKLPPPRIVVIGPTGTGKSLHSRQIALNLNLVHIDFSSLLQEIIFPKFGRKIGKQYVDHEPIPDVVLPPLEETTDEVEEGQAKLQSQETDRSNIKADNASKENESEQPPVMDEHETNISEYLLNSTQLPNETLEWLLGKLWKQEPYKSIGFILDGFPQTTEDLQFLITSNYFFDCAVFLNTEVDEVVSRLLPPRLEAWRKRMAKKAENASKLKEWKAAKKKLAMEKRRAEILKELQEKRENARMKESTEDGDTEEDEELEDEVNIDEMLAEDFAEEEDEMDAEEEETEADAIERLTEDITESFTEASDVFGEIAEQIEELSIPKYEVDSGGKVTWARYRVVKRLHNVIENRNSLFERVYPITPKIAERLIANGYCFPSRFGRWCPVTLHFQDIWLPPVPMPPVKVGNPKYLSVLPGIVGETLPVNKAKTCAAIYKQHIYWFANQNARTVFMKNPLKYTDGHPDPPYRIPLRLNILGAPKTGKTTKIQIYGENTFGREFGAVIFESKTLILEKRVANTRHLGMMADERIAKEYNIPIVNAGDCVRWILKDPSHMYTSLANRIREQFNLGEVISDELTAEAIHTLLMNGIYFTRGYILENYPLTKEQGEILFTYGVRPNLTIHLTVTDEKQKEELILRGITEASQTLHSKPSDSHVSLLTSGEEQYQEDKRLKRRGGEEEEQEIEGEGIKEENIPERNEEGFKQPVPEIDNAQELVIRLAAYDTVIPQLREWYISYNGLMVELDAIQNRWLLWRKVIALIKHRMKHLQAYMEGIIAHNAVSIAELGIQQSKYEELASEFRQYCPVSLREKHELEDTINEPKHEFIIQLKINDNANKASLNSNHNHNHKHNRTHIPNNNNNNNNNSYNNNNGHKSENSHVNDDFLHTSSSSVFEHNKVDEEEKERDEFTDALKSPIKIYTKMRFTAEYNGHYYRMAGPNELHAFLTNPERYIRPNNMCILPQEELIPMRLRGDSLKRIRDSFPIQLALNGYCPVCFQHSKSRYEGLKLGLSEYIAHYDNKFYTFCSNDCLLEFLRKPVLFYDLKLPHKLPPIANPITLKSLPLPGFLEQTLGIALCRALSAVGQDRPKFPFIKIKRSALIYMGLHLKAYNPRFSIDERKKYQEKLKNYIQTCLLIPWLAKSMPLPYYPVAKRSSEFNKKLDDFLNCEECVDQPETWIEWDK